MADPYVYSSFRLSAVIDGQVFNDIVAMSATFGLNSIPTASLTVAVGHEASSGGQKQAKIHTARKKMKPRAKAIVTLTITPEEGAKLKMEAGTFVIFEGAYAGIGYQRSHNSANYTIQLVHWLDALNNSSAMNGNWFPGAMYALQTNAGFQSLEQTSGGGEQGAVAGGLSSVPMIDGDNLLVRGGNVTTDFWDLVIKPLFKALANCPMPDNTPNTAALKALDKMPGTAAEINNVPLALDLGANAEDCLLDSIRTALVKTGLDSFAHTTFWGKLIGEYAAQFFFAVSPGVEHALVVPFFAGLQFNEKSEHAKHIRGDEYSYANFNASLTQLLESVMIVWSPQNDFDPSEINDSGETQFPANLNRPAGEYPPAEAGTDRVGMKLFKEPPTWLSNVTPMALLAGPTTGVGGKSPGDCAAPGTGEPKAPDGALTPTETLFQLQQSDIYTRLAEHWYKTEKLSHRQGELSGKLRFDIAPGSIVRIETPTTEIASDGAMIAAVTQVSYAINAERGLAGTSFTLAYVRTEEEDADTVEVSGTHAPLYGKDTAWYGGNLKTTTQNRTTI